MFISIWICVAGPNILKQNALADVKIRPISISTAKNIRESETSIKFNPYIGPSAPRQKLIEVTPWN